MPRTLLKSTKTIIVGSEVDQDQVLEPYLSFWRWLLLGLTLLTQKRGLATWTFNGRALLCRSLLSGVIVGLYGRRLREDA